jgi:hypothetical protein
MDPVVQMALFVAALLMLGALGEYIFSRSGVPDMVWLVAAGIIAGPVFQLTKPEIFTTALPFFGAIARIPSVRFALWGGGFSPQQHRLMMISIPRGLAAAVLSTLPLHSGTGHAEPGSGDLLHDRLFHTHLRCRLRHFQPALGWRSVNL